MQSYFEYLNNPLCVEIVTNSPDFSSKIVTDELVINLTWKIADNPASMPTYHQFFGEDIGRPLIRY